MHADFMIGSCYSGLGNGMHFTSMGNGRAGLNRLRRS